MPGMIFVSSSEPGDFKNGDLLKAAENATLTG
jgi:hypothetical protein